jgi:hypothetical protein
MHRSHSLVGRGMMIWRIDHYNDWNPFIPMQFNCECVLPMGLITTVSLSPFLSLFLSLFPPSLSLSALRLIKVLGHSCH